MKKMGSYMTWSKEALIARIKSLEAANNALNSSGSLASSLSGGSDSESDSKLKKKKKNKDIDFSKYSTRRVAIRFAYLGWNYHGLAYQREGHRTVEYEILRAFHKTKCIPSIDPYDCNLSRCGRTDSDVSAMAQVISLDLRSILSKEEHDDPQLDAKELDYLKILNSHLPSDILAYQICLRPPPGFDARFSCTGRHYHYYFDGAGLNIEMMQLAAEKFVGEHDFRNFCKIDGSKQISNYTRGVKESKILKQEGSNLYYLSLRGNAFLWNQVRSIMAILFLVGQGHEKPDIVDKLLDIEKFPCRPAYEIAWGVPLVLYNCEFPENMEWKTSRYTSTEGAHNVWYELLQKQNMTQQLINRTLPFCASPFEMQLDKRLNTGQGIGRRCGNYVPVEKRPVSESPDVQNEKWRLKREKKIQ